MSDTTTGLREWARGNYGIVAATEMLIRGFDGRFAGAGYPWIKADGDRYWVDFDGLFVEATGGPYSGGETRFLLAAASIGGVNNPVSLYDVVEMGGEQLDLFLAALSYSAGSPAHPWPGA